MAKSNAPEILSVSNNGAATTQSEMAKQEFLQGLAQIPGASAETFGGETLAEQSIRVYVPDVLGPVADQVYTLQIRIHRHYRHARLNVEVEAAPNDVDKGAYSDPDPLDRERENAE